jgi:DNA-binding beta-propeller fold protein YncE
MYKKTIVMSAISVLFLAACGGSDNSGNPAVAKTVSPQLFAQTNDTTNAVLHFTRNADGTLSVGTTVPTGGKGTGGVTFAAGGTIGADSLTSDNSVAVSADSTRLFVTNTGDNTVSVFAIDPAGGNPTLLATSPTGGCCQRRSRLPAGYYMSPISKDRTNSVRTESALTASSRRLAPM